MKPYVGITGAASKKEADAVLKEFANAGFTMQSGHVPMLGILVSYKRLMGIPQDNLQFPRFQEVYFLLKQGAGKALTMVHYNSREISTLSDQVYRIFNHLYRDDVCKAVQLNITWPDIKQVKQIKKDFPEMQIVFEANKTVLEGKSAGDVAQGIKQYGSLIDYVLIDPSEGNGEEFDVNNSIHIYQELKDRLQNVTIGFAGGFTGENVEERVQRLASALGNTDFCIDAQGKLRDKVGEAYGQDKLNIKKVKAYLQNASKILK